jgi:hypothetical protein
MQTLARNRLRTLAGVGAAGFLVTLNLWLAWQYCSAEYTKNLQSNEGAFIAMTRVFAVEKRPFFWWPYWNAGMPSQYVYAPLLPALSALVSQISGWSPARSYHWTAGVLYSLGAFAAFILVYVLTGSYARSTVVSGLWSLVSPSCLLIRDIASDTGGAWNLRKLYALIYYAEAPHLVSLTFLLLSLTALHLAWKTKAASHFLIAGLMGSLATLTNAFGGASFGMAGLALAVAQPRPIWNYCLRSWIILAASTYLVVSPWLPPSLLRTIFVNSRNIGHIYTLTPKWILSSIAYLAIFVWLSHKLAKATSEERTGLRFAFLFFYLTAAITVMAFWTKIYLVFQPERYHHEMDLALCVLVGLICPDLQPMRKKAIPALIVLTVSIAALSQALRIKRQAEYLASPVTIDSTIEHHVAKFLAARFPNQRVMPTGSCSLWFNAFADTPQLSGGHDPTAPNWIQRVAVFMIYSGMNAGDRDAEISVLWLKAFGVRAISVHGSNSREHWKPFRNPRKFEGVLPVLWREGDDEIYQVPSAAWTYSHVIPAAALVKRPPAHGLDVEQVRTYVEAIERASSRPTRESYFGTDRLKIETGRIPQDHVLSIQMNYHPGWRAEINGLRQETMKDGLGLLAVKARCPDGCVVDLVFDGGLEQRVTSIASGLVTLFGVVWMLWWTQRR